MSLGRAGTCVTCKKNRVNSPSGYGFFNVIKSNLPSPEPLSVASMFFHATTGAVYACDYELAVGAFHWTIRWSINSAVS